MTLFPDALSAHVPPTSQLPVIIQGGMGAGVSSWTLANAVSRSGQLGVISGTGLSTILARRLQDGDPGGHMRRALAHFPLPTVAERLLQRYFVEGGKPAHVPYRLAPMYTLHHNPHLEELTVAGCFAEVWLAKAGHQGVVGINLLEKIQLPTLASLFGAMLAGVNYVLMGAGIPREIPGALDALSEGRPAALRVAVENAPTDTVHQVTLDPALLVGGISPRLPRPRFLAIVASATLAHALARKSTGRVDGFVIEGPTAGGHNAPPRGTVQLDRTGQPMYGPRDAVDLEQIRALGLPFWLAGGYADPERLGWALAQGAQGVQLGTVFALCEESGIEPALRRRVLDRVLAGEATVFTDPHASPTGYPFKVVSVPGTLSEAAVYAARARECDLGYLRSPYLDTTGHLGFRCPAEPVDQYVKKGGRVEDTVNRQCLCNSLIATIGLGQHRAATASPEPPIVTLGDDVASVQRMLAARGATSYTARNVLAWLLPENPA